MELGGVYLALVGFSICSLTFFFLILPLMPPAIVYTVKMSVYYFLLFFYGLIVAIVAAFTPRQLSNYKYPMALIKKTRYLFGLKFRVEQLEKMHGLKGSYVIVSNHQSSIDLIGVGLTWPYQCTIVAKKSLLFAGFFGFAAWLCNCVFVSRGRESARREMWRLAEHMAAGGASGEPLRVWIFPEGTRHAGPQLGEFKKGAFHLAVQAQVPIVPVVFSSYEKFYSSERKVFLPGSVTIRVLDAVSTAGKTVDDVAELSSSVRDRMNDVYRQLDSANN